MAAPNTAPPMIATASPPVFWESPNVELLSLATDIAEMDSGEENQASE